MIFSLINVLPEKLKRRDCVAIGLEPWIRFANKYSLSITAVANAHEEDRVGDYQIGLRSMKFNC